MSSASSGVDERAHFQDELRSLVDSIVACRDVKGEKNIIRALGHYLSVHRHHTDWFRMYSENPPWQQRSRLLNQELDKDIVLREGRPRVFYTLIVPHSRKDLRVGSWQNKGGNKQAVSNQFVMNKLYYTGDPNRTKEDGLTLVEFVPKMDQQHHVAICLLHRLDYRHLIRDLTRATNQRNLPGNQANQEDVPQHLAPVNLAPAAAGFMNGLQVSSSNIENMEYHHSPQIYNPNPLNTLLSGGSMYSMTSLGNIGMAGHDPDLPSYGTNPSNTFPINNDMHDMHMNVGYHHSPQIYMIPLNTSLNSENMYATTLLGNIGTSVGYPPDSFNSVEDPSNTWTRNNSMHDMPRNSHPSLLRSGSMYYTTSLGNIGMAGHDPDLPSYGTNPSNTFPINNDMHDMHMNVGYHHSPQIYMNPLNTSLNSENMYATTLLGNIGTSVGYPPDSFNSIEDPSNTWTRNNSMHDMPRVRHDPALPSYGTNPSNTFPINNDMHDMHVNVGYHHSPQSYMKPLNTSLNSGNMYATTSLENIGTSVGQPPDPFNSAEDPSNTWTSNNNMHDMPQLTEQDAQADQMSWQNDSSINSFVKSMNAFMPNMNAMASEKGPMLPTNFSSGAHFVTTEQNINQDAYPLLPDFLEHSSTI